MNNIALIIKKKLDDKGWSPYDLAEASGSSQPTIFRILYKNQQPTLKTLKKLAKGFGCSLAELQGLNIINDKPDALINKPALVFDPERQEITKPLINWTVFCSDYLSDIDKMENKTMPVNKKIAPGANSFYIQINNDNFPEFPRNAYLLVDPDAEPIRDDVIVLSFPDEPPTLARWTPRLGEKHITLLETGLPGSAILDNKDWVLHGVAIWWNIEGGRLRN